MLDYQPTSVASIEYFSMWTTNRNRCSADILFVAEFWRQATNCGQKVGRSPARLFGSPVHFFRVVARHCAYCNYMETARIYGILCSAMNTVPVADSAHCFSLPWRAGTASNYHISDSKPTGGLDPLEFIEGRLENTIIIFMGSLVSELQTQLDPTPHHHTHATLEQHSRPSRYQSTHDVFGNQRYSISRQAFSSPTR